MSNTLETDAEAVAAQFYYSHGDEADAVHADFARRLERERDAAQQRIKDIQAALIVLLQRAGGEVVFSARERLLQQAGTVVFDQVPPHFDVRARFIPFPRRDPVGPGTNQESPRAETATLNNPPERPAVSAGACGENFKDEGRRTLDLANTTKKLTH